MWEIVEQYYVEQERQLDYHSTINLLMWKKKTGMALTFLYDILKTMKL